MKYIKVMLHIRIIHQYHQYHMRIVYLIIVLIRWQIGNIIVLWGRKLGRKLVGIRSRLLWR